jgi:hypothetical protein
MLRCISLTYDLSVTSVKIINFGDLNRESRARTVSSVRHDFCRLTFKSLKNVLWVFPIVAGPLYADGDAFTDLLVWNWYFPSVLHVFTLGRGNWCLACLHPYRTRGTYPEKGTQ